MSKKRKLAILIISYALVVIIIIAIILLAVKRDRPQGVDMPSESSSEGIGIVDEVILDKESITF